ncbi:MarR family winged helix-turn-helix transcriptional regulator [Collimonas silvisoli]|uniref:MarR family winged helix-turn-helix transcriptional regulator n=1 Tax=Collimonas silvisoli TaxID=2825884 RepID=UPI001B8C521E|nr:MarR family transcriptional regulator [Collimonas silvisoli]
MKNLEQKYLSLLDEADRRKLPDLENIGLCFQMLSLAAAIDRDCAALLAPHGLSEGRFVLLFLLDSAAEGLAPNVLAEKAGVTRGTVTGLLDGLEREGFVERHADPADRRALKIRLTHRGKKMAGAVFNDHSQWIASLFGGLSVQERSTFSRLLEKVAASVETQAP